MPAQPSQVAYRQPVPGKEILDEYGRLTRVAEAPFESVYFPAQAAAPHPRRLVTVGSLLKSDTWVEPAHTKG